MSNWLNIGNLADIPMQGSRIVRKGELTIAVFRTAGNQIYALENKCAHKQGPLSEGIVHGCRVTCPLHNWVFDLKTGNATGADEGKVTTYPVKIVNGGVLISLAEIKNELAVAE